MRAFNIVQKCNKIYQVQFTHLAKKRAITSLALKRIIGTVRFGRMLSENNKKSARNETTTVCKPRQTI